MQLTTVKHLFDTYDAILIDAYGVLVDASGPLPGADAFVASLNAHKPNYYILTNDASRLPEHISERFKGFGLPVETSRIISSGGLLTPYFEANKLHGKRCIVLGNPDAVAYTEQAGGKVVEATADSDADVLVIADDRGYRFLDTLEAVLTLAMRRLDAGKPLHMVLCNPDLVYPKAGNAYGLTSGSVALILESALATRHGGPGRPRCVGLGKPFAPIFEAAFARTKTRNMVLIGDQLSTDILGAKGYGISSVLVGSGMTRVTAQSTFDPDPTYYLPKVGPLS